MIIQSTSNETYKKLLSLTTSKGLKEEGLFLLSGEKLVREFLDHPHLKIIHEIISPHHKPLLDAQETVQLAVSLFDELDVLGTHFNILVLTQPPLPTLGAKDMEQYEPQGIELVVPLGDPANLGALIRSCEAFAVPRIILTKEAAHPFLPKSVKASAGSVLRVPMARGPSLPEFPKSCIALDMEGAPIDQFQWPQHGLLIVGEEGPGFGNTVFPTRVSIITSGVESLNVVVAASIALSRLQALQPNKP